MNKIATTYQAYRVSTGLNGKPDKRGSKIAILDRAFQAYDVGFAGANAANQIRLTLELYTEAKDWLKNKAAKADTKTFLFTKVGNENLIRRRVAISNVAKECVKTLREVQQVTPGRATFEQRKIDMLAKGRTASPAVALSGGYANERRTWDTSGKTAAVAATTVHAGTTARGYAGTGFDELSEAEYRQLGGLGANQVLYFKKAARLQYMVDIDDAGRLCDANQVPLDWGLPDFDLKKSVSYVKLLQMYAMDRYCNLFQSPELAGTALTAAANNVQQVGASVKKYNHSSLNAGRDVICAGLIGIQKGYLTWLDYHSGHYKPTRENLFEAVSLLAAEGADLTHTLVGVYIHRPSGAIDRIDLFSAQHFLKDPNGNPDKGKI